MVVYNEYHIICENLECSNHYLNTQEYLKVQKNTEYGLHFHELSFQIFLEWVIPIVQ